LVGHFVVGKPNGDGVGSTDTVIMDSQYIGCWLNMQLEEEL
jgi:hypothetical protein